ncbi:MAG: hypothetical protein JW860_11690 [Sedimentisphaerales bacterium]|nr:hypothetical protein [Sedimentisphaerales bacterium]
MQNFKKIWHTFSSPQTFRTTLITPSSPIGSFFLTIALILIALGILVLLFPLILAFFVAALFFFGALVCLKWWWKLKHPTTHTHQTIIYHEDSNDNFTSST